MVSVVQELNARGHFVDVTFVLLTILLLSLCSAMSNGVHRVTYCRYSPFPFAAPGVLLLLMLTEWTGRKVLFISLFILSLISSIIYLFRFYFLSFIVYTPVQGAAVALISVVICEYCNPKDRFFYLILNSAIEMLIPWVTLILTEEVRNVKLDGYTQYFNICLGVIGLYLVFKWPESPYWLASKRRFEESAQAFLAVRGGNSESSEELRALTDPRPRPASNKMFYVPILIALPIICMSIPTFDSVDIFIAIYDKFFLSRNFVILTLLFSTLKCIAAVASVVSIFIPVKLSRKVLFLLCSILFATHVYVIAALVATSEIIAYILAFVIYTAVDIGPKTVALPLLIEIISNRYASAITAIISVMYIAIESFVCADTDMSKFGSWIVFLSFVVCYFVVPETKNKTLLQIEQLYTPKEKNAAGPSQTDV